MRLDVISGPTARIILRYLATALASHGVLTADVAQAIGSDPDIFALLQPIVEIVLGVVCGVIAECWYAAAKRYGWST